ADLRAQLAAVAAAFAARTGRNVQAMVAASLGETELAKAFRNQFIAASRRAGAVLLERAMAASELRPDLDLEVTLDLIYGPLYYRLLVGHAPLDAAFTDALLDHALLGLAGRRGVDSL
ncbi:MAG TPA: TetR-like C-terminal domain-containing protein, partial [Geminicoccaceae bacterium]|nr:TetR-like C-terminal domain-containing protein [Geminicoccaceae bacterium]